MPGCRQRHKAGGMKSRETVYLAYFIEIPHSQLRLVLLLAKIQVIWQLRCQHLKFAFPFASSVLARERDTREPKSGGDCETVADSRLLSYAALITRYISPESARKYTNSHTPCTHSHTHTQWHNSHIIFSCRIIDFWQNVGASSGRVAKAKTQHEY